MTDFVCMADHRFVKWLSLSVPSIRAAHPDARIFVFDLSPEHPDVRTFCACHDATVAVPYPKEAWRWPGWIDQTDFAFFWPRFSFRESVKYWGRRLRKALTGRAKEDWMIDKRELVRKTQNFCRIVSLKPHVLARALELTKRNVVFIDADAVLLKPVHCVFEKKFDLGATCDEPDQLVVGPNPPECLDRPYYPIRALNTGVVFLRNNAAARSMLADWIAEMETVLDVCTEQTALANLIMRKSGGFFAKTDHCVTISANDGTSVRVANLPMRLFNSIATRLDSDRLPDGAYIVHFVGSLKKDKHWERVRTLVANARADNTQVEAAT